MYKAITEQVGQVYKNLPKISRFLILHKQIHHYMTWVTVKKNTRNCFKTLKPPINAQPQQLKKLYTALF